MGQVIVGTTMSLDGFNSDREGSVARLYLDLKELRKTEMLQETMKSSGAVVMGRHAYDMADGDFTGEEFIAQSTRRATPRGQPLSCS